MKLLLINNATVFICLFSFATTAQTLQKGNALIPRALEPAKNHYAKLKKLNPSPQANALFSDTRQFDLNALSPRYANNLKLRAVYVDVPLETFTIGNFPANSSAETKAEIDFLKSLADTARTVAAIEASEAMAGIYYRNLTVSGDSDYTTMRKNLFHMGYQLGNWFGPDSLPVTANLMEKVWQDASYYMWALKFKYNRIRPYQLDSSLIF